MKYLYLASLSFSLKYTTICPSTQNTSDDYRCITGNLKEFRKVKMSNNGCPSNLLLDLPKGCACSIHPFEFPFLHAISDGDHNDTKILNKLPIKDGQPMKTTNLRKSLWFGPLFNSSQPLTFVGSIAMPYTITMNPKKRT